MKYTVSTEIALPRGRVVGLLADPVHLPMWLRGLVLHEPISGSYGEVGGTSRVVLQMGKQKIEATETITRREPVDLREIPSESVVRFEREIVMGGHVERRAGPVYRSRSAHDAVAERERVPVSSLLMRLMGLLMPGAFRKQSQQHMQDFKAFAEQGQDVRNVKD